MSANINVRTSHLISYCFLLWSFFLSGTMQAQTFTFKSTQASEKLTASDLYHHGLPDTMTVWCNQWNTIMANLATWGNNMKLKSSHSFVKLYADNFYPKTQNNYTYQILYTVYGYYDPNDTVSHVTATTDTLTISNFNHNDPHNAYQDIQMAKYSNYYKTKVVIWAVLDYNTSGSAILSDSTRWDFAIESSIATQQYDKTHYGAGTSLEINSTASPADNYLDLSFQLPGGSPPVQLTPCNYELEWTYVDDYQVNPTTGALTAKSSVSYDFANDNTRVWLDSGHYRIPLVYPRGYVVYRVRMVRPDSEQYRYPIYSDWSYSVADAGTISSLSGAGTGGSGAYYPIASAYSNDSLNWQYTVSFAEGGRYKHVASFYDGLLKNRESITRFNSNLNKLIVTKNIYDFEGRPAIKTLPAPVGSSSFSFQHNVDINSVTGNPYQAGDFDTGWHICPLQPQLSPLDPGALANIYYSNQNPDTSGVQRYVPDAEGYPLVQTIYAPAFNDRVEKQGGAGKDLQIAQSNVIQNYYVTSQQAVLNRLFGLNVGWNDFYNMTISSDPNLQLSMSIKDYKGKMVASSMIGTGPSPLDHAINPINAPPSSYFSEDILAHGTQEIIGNMRIADKAYFNEVAGNDSIRYVYTFSPYPVCPGEYLSLKAHYYYEVTDQCGDTVFTQDSTLGISGVVPSPVSFSGSTGIIHANTGPYYVHKELTVDDGDIDGVVDQYMAMPPTCLHKEPWFIRQSVQRRNFPCPGTTDDPCELKRQQMILDLYPGGKYGKYTDSSGMIIGAGLGGSIFDWTSTGEGTGHYGYQDTCLLTRLPDSITIRGVTYHHLRTLSVDSFLYVYNLSIAVGDNTIANALLPLHPDFCKRCINDTFKTLLLSLPDAATAQSQNLLYLDSIVAHDPLLPYISGLGADSLKTFPRGHIRLDSMELIQIYCGCGDTVELKECVGSIFSYEIRHRLLINDFAKNQYFKDMINMYLHNRDRFVDAYLYTPVTGDTCSLCSAIRLRGVDALPPVTSSWGSPSTDLLDSVWIHGDSTAAWVLAAMGGSTTLDSATLAIYTDSARVIYTRADSIFCYGAVDSIIARLANCGNGDTILLAGIRATLDSFCATHTIHSGGYTPDIIRYAIVRNGGTINDFCNPYLVSFGLPSYSTPMSADCMEDGFYTDIKIFFNQPSVLQSLIFPGTTNAYTLGAGNMFESEISAYLGSVTSVSVSATYDTANSLYTIKVFAASGTDTARIYLRGNGTGTCAHVFGGGAVGDTVSVAIIQCVNAVPRTVISGLINEYSFIATVNDYATSGRTTCSLLGWTDSIATMTDRNNKLNNAIPCTEMRRQYIAFSDTMKSYGVRGADHPLWDNMLQHFMNYVMPQYHSAYQYETFIGSCALADSMFIPLYFGYANLTFDSVADADTFISMLNSIDPVYDYSGSYRDSDATSGIISLSINLRHSPYSELWKYRYAIDTFSGHYRSKVVDSGLSYVQPDSVMGFIYAYPGSTMPSPTAVFGGVTTLSISPTPVTRGVWRGTYFVPQDCYYVYYSPVRTTPTEVSAGVYQLRRYFLNHHIAAAFISNFQSTVNKDYFQPKKQDYLRYNYSYEPLPSYRVLDSIQAQYLTARISSYAGADVTYNNPVNPVQISNLYLSDSTMETRFFDTLTYILNTVATVNTVNPNHIFFTPNSVSVYSTLGSPLYAYRCSDGSYWYRYFGTGDTLYNVYVAMPQWVPRWQHTRFKIISVGPPPGIMPALGDSNSRYFTLNLKDDTTGVVIQARGMSTFVIAKNMEFDNVLLANSLTSYSAPPPLDTFDNCERNLLNFAIRQGMVDYNHYIDSVSRAIRAGFRAYMMTGVHENLFLGYLNDEFNYTLYQYDRAGNLQQTVPPAGVNFLSTSGIDAVREANPPALPPVLIPSHNKVSSYNYNTINQVVKQNTPDGGVTRFFYDAAGRLIFSQNMSQRSKGAAGGVNKGYLTYNLYDHQNRIVETGEAPLACPYFDEYDTVTSHALPACYYSYPSDSFGGSLVISPYPPVIEYLTSISHDSVIRFIHAHDRMDVVRTIYDTALLDTSVVTWIDPQQNLRHRVSAVKYAAFNSWFDTTVAGYDYANYYSYDIDGNVKTLVHDFPYFEAIAGARTSIDLNARHQRYKRVDYDYDLISGKVNLLSYNRSFIDQYYQRYSYDDDNRITKVETSSDGYIWHQDAEYTYYEHGPLARIDVGDQRVQGIDYAYTLQGWLKIMNADTLSSSLDMGGDGNVTINAVDAVAYSVDYFKNDYKPITVSSDMKHVQDVTRSLYNGNISRQTMAIANFQRLTKQYAYDQLNRINTANYSSINPVTTALNGLNDYHNNYGYDADGNITNLVRYGNNTGTGAQLMDSLQYIYGTGGGGYSFNQLKNLIEAAPDVYTNDIRYNFPSAMATPSYKYDPVGNMTLDGIGNGYTIGWNLYNKATQLTGSIGGVPTIMDWYDYDGAGNRVGKHYSGSGILGLQSDYFFHDAQGNVLATYHEGFQKRTGWITYISHFHSAAVGTGGGFTPPSYIHAVISPYFGGNSIFRASIISYSMLNPTFLGMQTSHPVTYYLSNSLALYRKVVSAEPSYVMPLVRYERAGSDTIVGPALCAMTRQQPHQTEKMLGWLFKKSEMKGHVLPMLCAVGADSLVAATAVYLGRDTTMGCDTMISLLADPSYNAVLPSIIVKAAQLYPGEFDTYLDTIAKDSLIYADLDYSNPSGGYIGMLEYAVANYGNEQKMITFLGGYTQTPEMVSHVSTTPDLLGICYDVDRDGYLIAFDSVLGDAYLDSATAADSAHGVAMMSSAIHHSGTVGSTWGGIGGWGTVLNRDAFGLAEHDIYGSSRLGIKTYWPNQIGVERDYLHGTYDTVRLWERKPWYSQEYQDVIRTDSLTPYSSTLTDKLVTGHLTGQKQYEATDHLGDVLATVSDSRSPNTTVTPATIAYYTPVLQSEYDYYPFGMLMPGRYTSDTTLHCTTLSEEKLIPTPVSTWVSWVLGGGSPLSPIGGGTLTSPGSGVLISTSAAGDGALYDLSSLTLGMPYELDLMVDSASIGYQAQIIQDDTLVLATVDINPGGSAMRPVHFTASSSTLGLQVVAGTATTGYVGIGGHYAIDTVMVPKLVVTTECSDGSYPYGFNGKYKDNEWAGLGNHLNFGDRLLDSRTGRMISIDPLIKKFPSETPYGFAGNNPIMYLDVKGDFRMSLADCQKYPEICEWVYNNNGILRLARSQMLQQMYSNYTKATTTQVNADFKPGEGPFIHPEKMWIGKGGEYNVNLNINEAFFKFYTNAANDEDRQAALYCIGFEVAHEEGHNLVAQYGANGSTSIDANFNENFMGGFQEGREFLSRVSEEDKFQAACDIVEKFKNGIQLPNAARNPKKAIESETPTTNTTTTTTNYGDGNIMYNATWEPTQKELKWGRKEERQLRRVEKKVERQNGK
jgi:RHS repeat-associated protein